MDGAPGFIKQEYVVIFSQGDEAYSGLLDFAEEYHITSGRFTAIGAQRAIRTAGENR